MTNTNEIKKRRDDARPSGPLLWDDLAPCPFCGGAAIADFIEGASYAVKCSACYVRTWHMASASVAAAAWNQRAGQRQAGAIGRFEGYVDGVPLVRWFDRAKMPQPGEKLHVHATISPVESPCSASVMTWRERIGVGTDFPLHAPTDVERAMVAEIAEQRQRLGRAERSLLRAGFEDRGGQEWAPPLGRPPAYVQDVDPLDTPLPCDITVGPGTMHKGVPLRTLVLRMRSLHAQLMARMPVPTPEQRAALDALLKRGAPAAVEHDQSEGGHHD